MHLLRTHVRTLGFAAALTSCAALTLFGCKSQSETFQTRGAVHDELNREGTGAAHDHQSTEDHILGMPPDENPSHHREDHQSTPLDRPGEQGLVPGSGHGIGGGPKDESAWPWSTPPSTEKDKTTETPGATENEVTDEDVKTSPPGPDPKP